VALQSGAMRREWGLRRSTYGRFRLDMDTRQDLTAPGGGLLVEPNEFVDQPTPVPAAPDVRAP
jgi:hypothetical protein